MSSPSPPMTPAPHAARALLLSALVLALDLVLLTLGVGGVTRLLHHTRALALFATWLIAYPTLAVLRPVRSHDPVAGRSDLRVLIALFLIPLVTPPLAALAERAGLAPLPGGGLTRWGGVALAALGLALRIAAMMRLGSRFSPVAALQRGHTLETRGIYGVVRHPGYLGAWLCDLGIVLAFGSAPALLLPLAMAIAITVRVRSEERLLAEQFGDAYRAYRSRVGGFVPRPGAPPSL